ncbi:hypothetical protein HDU88_008006 [Geranomyces variabilis]|nr:hypothetical protein HDU88_008006 [Geranomyces variabilis]
MTENLPVRDSIDTAQVPLTAPLDEDGEDGMRSIAEQFLGNGRTSRINTNAKHAVITLYNNVYKYGGPIACLASNPLVKVIRVTHAVGNIVTQLGHLFDSTGSVQSATDAIEVSQNNFFGAVSCAPSGTKFRRDVTTGQGSDADGVGLVTSDSAPLQRRAPTATSITTRATTFSTTAAAQSTALPSPSKHSAAEPFVGGKLFQENPTGIYNFDHDDGPISPLTNKRITTWYKPGESFNSLFGSDASSYEECRAEAVFLYLCIDKEILQIFGHMGPAADDIVFSCYLKMARAGLLALEYYDPKAKKWGQAHMQARYAILRVLLSVNLITITVNSAGSLQIHLDRSRIHSEGRMAVETFLQKLNVYKATADVTNGLAFYRDQTAVPEAWFRHREIVMRSKQPRKMLMQGNTFMEGGRARYKAYPASLEGFLESCIERHC